MFFSEFLCLTCSGSRLSLGFCRCWDLGLAFGAGVFVVVLVLLELGCVGDLDVVVSILVGILFALMLWCLFWMVFRGFGVVVLVLVVLGVFGGVGRHPH